jgi:hypothetical protein
MLEETQPKLQLSTEQEQRSSQSTKSLSIPFHLRPINVNVTREMGGRRANFFSFRQLLAIQTAGERISSKGDYRQ